MEEKKNNNSSKKSLLISVGVTVAIITIIGGILLVKGINKNRKIENDNSGGYSNYQEGKKSTKNNKENGQGKIYKKVSLNDTNSNIKAFEGLIPEGWNASIQSNWNIVSSTCPGLEEVTITSPDGKASIVIDSQQAFVENSRYQEGVNYDYYTTYLHYMDGDEFVQYYIDNTYGESATLIKDFEDDDDLLEQANECTRILVEQGRESSEWINTGRYGMNYSLTAVPATMSKRQYQIGNQYLEGSCVIMASDSVLESNIVGANESRNWNVTYSIVFLTDDKETFDKYYDDYSFIVANANFTTDYYAMIEYVSSAIVNSYSSYYAAKSQAGLDAMNNYIDSNYSSTSAESTNDKVMQMWDDYINDVDSYDTLDGRTIKTSIFNDTVAQDGDNFYVGSKAGIPLGYTELPKTDISKH